jgi:hypothetical protein
MDTRLPELKFFSKIKREEKFLMPGISWFSYSIFIQINSG